MSISDFIKNAKKNIAKKQEIPEIKIENKFVSYAKQKGCKALKLVFLVGRGFPDRTVLCPGGQIFFIEFKKKGKKLSPMQEEVKIRLVGFGFSYFVCDRIGQAEKILERFLK